MDYETEQDDLYYIGSILRSKPVEEPTVTSDSGIAMADDVDPNHPNPNAEKDTHGQSFIDKTLSNVGSVGSDVGKAIVKGVPKGAEETLYGAAELVGAPVDTLNWVMSKVPGVGQYISSDMPIGGSDSIKAVLDAYNNFVNDNIPGVQTANTWVENLQYDNEMLGGIMEGVAQFSVAAVPAATMVKALTSANAFVRGLYWGAIADYAAFNPNDPTLTVSLTKMWDGATPAERTNIGNTVVSILEKNENNPEIINRAKSAIEGGILGGATEGVIKALMLGAKYVPWKPVAGATAGSVAMSTQDAEAGILTPIVKRLLPFELSAMGRATKDTVLGNAKQTLNAARNEVLRVKNLFPKSEGWLPLTLQTNTEKPIFTVNKKGEIKPRWQKISWGFHKPKRKGTTVKTHKNNMVNTLVNDVNDLVQRAKNGDQKAIDIINQGNWYRNMRTRLREEFGGLADVFADILGATSAQTNVKANWENSIEVLRRFTRGEFDEEIALYQKRLKEGGKMGAGDLHQLDANQLEEFKLIRKASGELFNANSPAATTALINTFRQIKEGKAPKTINFTGNLIGYTNEATVDVWAARYLRRIAGYDRIPTVAEKTVSGQHLKESTFENPQIGAEFAFGQDVFSNAVKIINQQGGIKSINPNLGDLGADDLQAIIWFKEKEIWTDNGWTNKAGEGGSLDFEASLAGNPNQERISELRSIINSAETNDADRLAAEKELKSMKVPLGRTVLGVTGERPDFIPTNVDQAGMAQELIDVTKNDQNVIAPHVNSTIGEFAGVPERSLNAEFVVNSAFDATALTKKVVELGRKFDQDSVFISKVVDVKTPNALPGYEIYFTKAQSSDFIRSITELLRKEGIDGFTFVTDARQADRAVVQAAEDPGGTTATGALTGFRFQYIPEFDKLYNGNNLAERINIMKKKHKKIVIDLLSQFPEINIANQTFYDTKVFVNRDRTGTEWINGGTSYEDHLGTRVGGSVKNEGIGEISGSTATTNRSTEVRDVSAGDVSNRISEENNESFLKKKVKSLDVSGITAYHGSGKDFKEFSFEKIGTGTGQTYFGYGLYFDTDKTLATNFKGDDGKVYKVDLKVADDEFIEAEIPLNKQPEKVQNILKKYYKRYNVNEGLPVSQLIQAMPNNPASVDYIATKTFAKNLVAAGIKAIKYKQLSHPTKKTPSDTFVVFDDKVIEILEKYGIVGAVSLTAINREEKV